MTQTGSMGIGTALLSFGVGADSSNSLEGSDDEPDKNHCQCCRCSCAAAVRCCKYARPRLKWLGECLLEQTGIALLQLFQWWLLMICVLLYFLGAKLAKLQNQYSITLDNFRYQTLPEPLSHMPFWLAIFSLDAFAALVILYAVSIVSILLQLITHFTIQVWKCNLLMVGSGIVSYPRDVAISVLALPMVYGLMAAECVSCMWSNMTGMEEQALHCGDWNITQQQEIQREIFYASFALGDMYEAWALYCFGEMVAKVLQPDLREKINLSFFRTFEELLLIDVKGFVLVGVLTASYTIGLTYSKWRFGTDICEAHNWVCSLQPYLVGANWCVSSVAIYNLFTIETKFHGLKHMEKFKGSLKFWSIKLMVIVSFWISLLMGIIRNYFKLTDDQGSLLDATFRIYVMTIVAVMNVKAWWPWTNWYQVVDQALEDTEEHDKKKGKDHKMRDIGAKRAPPGAIRMVEELLKLSPVDAQDLDEVKKKIDGLSQDGLLKALYHGSQLGWGVNASLPTSSAGGSGGLFRSRTGVDPRKHMIDLTHEERRAALTQHIASFYFADNH